METPASKHVRTPLIFQSVTRDAARTKGSWLTNMWIEGSRVRKRFGLTLDTSGASPGQGLLIYGTAKVSIRNDTLYVDGADFTL